MNQTVNRKLFIQPTTLRKDDLLPYMSSSPKYHFEDNEKTLAREFETRYHSGDRLKPIPTTPSLQGITLVDKSVSITSSKQETKFSLWVTKIKKLLRIGKK